MVGFPSSGYKLLHLDIACTVTFVENVQVGVGTTQISRNTMIMFVVRIENTILEMPNELSLGIGRSCSVSGLDHKYY